MNVLIIGGAGYIGSHQVKYMCDKNYNVIVIDNLNTGYEEAVDRRATFIKADIRNYDNLCKIITNYQIDSVIHFAALSLVGESTIKPLDYYNNNVHGMEILLKAMVACEVKKIIFSSTAAVYGFHEQMPINEDYDTTPINPYGETKLAMEKMMKWIDEAYGVKAVILRYFNVAGADESGSIGEAHNPETHLIPIVIQAALGQRPYISIYGDDYQTPDGTCIRDYVHVTDLVNAHYLALQYLEKGNKSDVFNVGYGDGYSVKEIIDAARKVTNKDIKVVVEARRSGDPDQLIASNNKIKKTLNWEPQNNDLEKIIASAYSWHNKNPNGYNK